MNRLTSHNLNGYRRIKDEIGEKIKSNPFYR